jgi:hypothetical protein
MAYNGQSVDRIQDVATVSTVAFQSKPVLVTLKDSQGTPIEGGMVACNMADTWVPFGTTDADGEVRGELMAGEYDFRMSWDGLTAVRRQDVAADANVAFQTYNVAVVLRSSLGAGIADGQVSCAVNGGLPLGATAADGVLRREMLPGVYTFSMSWGNMTVDRQLEVAANVDVVFQTVMVRVTLKNKAGKGMQKGKISFTGDAMEAFGVTDKDGVALREMLPGIYNFVMKHDAAKTFEKEQDIAENPNVDFQF